jgi:hypothetical protein
VTEPSVRTRFRKGVYTLLIIVFMLAVFRLAQLIVKRADERPAENAEQAVESTGTQSITTYGFEGGEVVIRLGALGVAASDGEGAGQLRAEFKGALANRLDRPIRVRDMEAVTRGGESLRRFRLSFEKTTVSAGQDYAFSGTAPVDAGFFNGVIRGHDLVLRIATDAGALEAPLQVYTLEVAPALAAGLLKTNRVRFGDAEGMINFLNCEQASAQEVCEPMLRQMGAP